MRKDAKPWTGKEKLNLEQKKRSVTFNSRREAKPRRGEEKVNLGQEKRS